MSNDGQRQATNYFVSPQQAVEVITDLLRGEDFRTLASYYNLSGSGIAATELESGDFFIRKERPELAHPGGFWRYKQPFAVGFKYSGVAPGSGKDIYIIHLSIEIDQGEGSPIQEGRDSFLMIQSEKGWQLLPGEINPEDESAQALQAPEPLPRPSWIKD